MSLGLQGVDWQNLSSDYLNDKRRTFGYYNNSSYSANYNTNNVKNTYSTVSQTTGNTCTDGKDDGHVGLLEGIYHVGKGALKGLWNGVKGCVTNSEGKFSLGKTLLTVGIGAACIAFPAIGFVLAGVGIVAGGAMLINGISDASKATTDADKKDALENVGDGGLTLAMSVAGARASYSAVLKTTGAAGAVNSMKNAGTWENASFLQKASAFGSDMLTSIKNCWGNIKDTVTNVRNMDSYDYALKAKGLVSDAAAAQEKLSEGTEVTRYFNNLKGNNIIETIKNYHNTFKFKEVFNALSSDCKAVINFLKNPETTYSQAVNKFGYENVAQALETFASYRMLDETV